jgi:hypothetical protein
VVLRCIENRSPLNVSKHLLSVDSGRRFSAIDAGLSATQASHLSEERIAFIGGLDRSPPSRWCHGVALEVVGHVYRDSRDEVIVRVASNDHRLDVWPDRDVPR